MSARRRRQNHSGGFLLDNAAGRNSIGSAGQSSSQGRFSFESTSQPSSSEHRVPSVKDGSSLRNDAGPIFTSSPISSSSLKGKEREGSASPRWHDENTTNTATAFASDPSQIVNLALSLSEERKKLFANKRLSSLNPSRSVRVSSSGSRNEHVFPPSPQGQAFSAKDEFSLPSVQSALPTTLSASTVGRVTKAKRELELRAEYVRLLDIVPESFGVEHSRVNAVRNRASRLGEKKSAVISHPAWNNVQTVQTWVNAVKRATELCDVEGSYAPDVPKFDSLADETVLAANGEDVTTKPKQKVRGRPTKLMWSIDPAELLADLYIQLKTQPVTRNNETRPQDENGVTITNVEDDDLMETMSNTVSDRGSWKPNLNRQLSTRSASTKTQDYGLSRTTSWSSSDSDRYRKRDILKRSATFLKSKVQTPATSAAKQDKQSRTTTSATNLKTPPRALVGSPSDSDFQRSPDNQDRIEHSRTPPNGAHANGRKSFESSLGGSPRIPTAISIQNVDSDLNLPSFMIEPRPRERPTLPKVLTTALSRQGTRPTTPLDTSVANDTSKRNDDLLSPESAARPPPLRKSSSISALGNMSDREDGYTSAGRDNRKRNFLTRPATKLGDLITRREAMRKHPNEYLQSGTASEVSDVEDADPKIPRRRPLSRRSTTENVSRVQATKLRTADLPKENKYFLRNLPAFKSSLDYDLVTPLNASVANGVWGDTKSMQSSTDLTQKPLIEDIPAEEEAAHEEQTLKPRQVIGEMTRKYQDSHDPFAMFDPTMIYLSAAGQSELDRPTQAKVLFTWYEVRNSTLQCTNASLYTYLNNEPDATFLPNHKPFSTNLHLLDVVQKEQLSLEDTLRTFSQDTVASLEDRIRKCTVEIRNELSPKCGQSTDAADALTAKLSTEYTLALKEISDRMEALIRRRRQRFRWVRRAGFALLEWVLRALMWVVWLVVVLLKMGTGTVRAVWSVVKWALWMA